MTIDHTFLPMLRSPRTMAPLTFEDDALVATDGDKYRINGNGIPLFAEAFCSADARRQQVHYDRVAENYLANLAYPHTQEYMRYLDDRFLADVDESRLTDVGEICCGGGEAFQLLGRKVGRGIGLDISESMLDSARRKLPGKNYLFIQGDATALPLAESLFDSVFIIGGIHHVNDRRALFQEIFRVLKPGGRFYWREPVSDLFLWQWLRAIVYAISPGLDGKTEHPLHYQDTVPVLASVGFQVRSWRTYGFLGYCFLMNSDILFFNRLFRYLPGIRALTRAMARFDDWCVRLPGMGRYGLIVNGVAEKPGD